MRTVILIFLCAASALAADTVAPPRPSPPLTIERLGAPPIELSQYRGKVVVLAFIFTTCSHCQDLTKSLKVIQKDYAARNVQVVTVACEEGVTNNFLGYLKAFEPNFPTGITNEGEVKKFVQWNDKRDGILYVPYMIFIDAAGIIRGDFNGKDGFFGEGDKNIRAQLDKLTKPAAAPAAKKK
jgi:thiol-disulfide isomerase/thioredoxin